MAEGMCPLILVSIGDAIIATDSQGRVTFLNHVATVLTGWTAAEALGQDITAVFPTACDILLLSVA